MSESLKDKTISGLKWSSIEKIFQQLFVLASGIWLGKMLTQTDFGLVAAISIFTYIANALQDSGFPAALIRKKNVTEADYNTVFYFNLVVAVVLYVVLFFCAPLISRIPEEPSPELIPLSRFIFLTFLFSALGSVQSVQMIKSLSYKQNTKIGITAIFVSYSLALILAYQGYGPWALAVQMVSAVAVRTLLFWVVSSWRPKLLFSWQSFRELFAFGSNLLLKSILDTVSSRITPSVISANLGNTATGIYDYGNRQYTSGADFISGTLLGVSFPVLSKVEGGDENLKRVFRKIMRATSFLIFPFFMGMALVARPFLVGVIDEKWIVSVPILQVLAIGGIFYSLNMLCSNVLKVKGKSSYILIAEIVFTSIIALTLVLAVVLRWDIYSITLGVLAANVAGYVINLLAAGRLINYTIGEHLKDILPYFGIASVSIAVGFLLRFVIDNLLMLFISEVVVVAAIYFMITYLTGSKIIKELLSLLKKNNA
ncbi:teichuronic acid exporter [Dysgonomonas sp. PH5-45]|uniref:lipopolysaccharide biosynthesis protein n=1 Tax=unclassified Dysgonomonas TaxID=2630389 RepID=UPI002474DCDC|nr:MULTISPECIES: lipopolysaccharide biosynthesis protein [unclassified Dysgonomonas]MDH6354847.1 teichuronic acid exporter [Dysgonomonas sp. PH5-45]MDH6387746.1 teichuronic acid exporter [Dysgonomonas sp. PH5-37]